MNLTQVLTGTLPARPYSPGTWYHGDRPCAWWPPLLMRLAARNLIGTPRYARTIRAAR